MKKNVFIGWTAVIISAIFFFYWFVQLSLNNTLIEFYIDRYNLKSYGSFTAMYLIGNVIMFIPAGVISDKYKSKTTISSSILIMIICIGLMILSSNTILAYICMLLIGFSGAFTMISCVKVSMKWFHGKSISLPISICISIAFLGGYCGNVLGRNILDTYNSGMTVQISNLILGVLILLITLIFMKEPYLNNSDITKKSIKTEIAIAWKLLFNKQNWYIGWCVSLLNFPVMLLEFSFGQQYLMKSFAMTSISSSKIAGLISIGFIFGTIFWSKLSDFYKTRKKIIILGIMLSALTSLLLLYTNFDFYTLSIIFVLIGVFTSSQTLGYTLTAELNHLNYTGTATAIISIFIMGGGAVAQIFFDSIKNYISYNVAYLVIPISMLFSLLLAVLIKEPIKRNN